MDHFSIYEELNQERQNDNKKLWKENRKLCSKQIEQLSENSESQSKTDLLSALRKTPSSSSSSASNSIKKHPTKIFQFEITRKDHDTKYHNKGVWMFPTVKRGPLGTLWNDISSNIRLWKKAPLDDDDKDSDESAYEDDEDDSVNEFKIKKSDQEKIYSLDIIKDHQLFIKFVNCLYCKLRTSNNGSVFIEKQNENPPLSEITSLGVFNVISSMFPDSDLPPYKLKDWYTHLIRGRKLHERNQNTTLSINQYHKLFCRRCYVYNCLLHSDKEKVRVESCASYPETINKNPPEPCDENCYLHSKDSMSNDEMDSSGIKFDRSCSSDSEEEEKVKKVTKTSSSPVILLSSSRLSKLNAKKKIFSENTKIPLSNNLWDEDYTLEPPEISRNTNKDREIDGDFSSISSDENEFIGKRKKLAKSSDNLDLTKQANGDSDHGLYSPINSDENFSDESEHGSSSFVESKMWSTDELTLLDALYKVYPNNSCKIAIIIQTKNCNQVKQYIDLHPEKFPKNLLFKKPKYLKRATGKTMNAWLTVRDKKELDAALPVENRSVPRYVPCFHPGKNCDDDCDCMKKKVPCEKFCCCATMDNIKCSIRFPGCTCHSANCCVKTTCSCRSAGRECDIDLCRCGQQDCSSTSLIICNNVDIQGKKGKKVTPKPSGVHGIGLYADEDLKKGDFVGEYMGEIISNHETERRSDRYNQIQSTYLFEKNKAESIDSMNFGNVLRFTNSSSSTIKANTKASRKYVYGDSRIALYAIEDIKKGQELFFNYENALKTQRTSENYKSLPIKRVNPTNSDDDFIPIRKNVAKKSVIRQPSSSNLESSSNEDSSED